MISGRSRVFAILGDPVAHSLSPAMHNAAFRALGLDAVYVALPVSPAELPAVVTTLTRAGGGGNVTVPHKELVAGVVAHPSDRVRALGACNTFWGEPDGIHGDNTDVEGVLSALDQLDAPPSAWLIAGTGGGARAAVAAAAARGARVAISSRRAVRREEFEGICASLGAGTAAAEECEVLINTTPLGLKAGDHLPLALEDAPHAQVAYDMVYAPGETAWVRRMRAAGLRAADGRLMLVAQGAAAFRRWFPDEDPPADIMRAAVTDALGRGR